jgi:glycosyltransferase involved in cell wall biosynthesis
MGSNSRLNIIGELSTNEHQKVYSKLLETISGHDKKFNIYVNLTHKETLEIIQSCDIFVLMSDFEPASISNIEAMASGKAIIVKSLNGTANYTLDNAGGFIVTDMDQLTLKINQFFKNQELIDDFGQLNIEIVKNNLNPNDIAGQLVKLLNL